MDNTQTARVGHRRLVAHAVVERGDLLGTDLLQRHCPEDRKNMKIEGHLVGLGRYRPAPDTEMDGQTAGRQIGDRGLGRWLRRQRIVAALDAVDHLCRLASPVFDRDGGIGSEGDPLQAGRPPGLHDIDLAFGPRKVTHAQEYK